MKNLFLIINIFFIVSVYSQSTNDTIIKHTKEHLEVKIISLDDNIITYTYPNETITQTISLNCVKEIKFSSGRVQKGTEKIEVNGVNDWSKVTITTNPNDVKCLVSKGEVRASASNSWNFKSKKQVDEKATMKIKKQAASLNGHIILLQDQIKKNMTLVSGATSDKYGIAYGYK